MGSWSILTGSGEQTLTSGQLVIVFTKPISSVIPYRRVCWTLVVLKIVNNGLVILLAASTAAEHDFYRQFTNVFSSI